MVAEPGTAVTMKLRLKVHDVPASPVSVPSKAKLMLRLGAPPKGKTTMKGSCDPSGGVVVYEVEEEVG